MANRTKIENLEELIKDSIGGELLEQTASSLLPPGENYGSVMYKVDFKVKKDGKEQEYHAVAKCTPLNTVTQEMFNIQETFKSEIAWYTTVIPTLKQFQRDHGVEKEIDFFQPFYGARISLDPKSDKVDLDGVILTQNLKYLGYYNIDRHVGFDLPTTYTILRDLAKFHAVPLAIKIHNPKLFDKNIRPNLPKYGDTERILQQQRNKQIYTVYKNIPECQPILDRIMKYVNPAKHFGGRPIREPWATAIHMDAWMNNIMITGGENSKNMFLDLSFPDYGSPAADLQFFLITSIQLDIIREKFDEFLKFYYQNFIKELKELNVPTENYTFEGLIEEMQIESKEGELAHALAHAFAILGEKEKSYWDSADADFKHEDLVNGMDIVPNQMQIERFKWAADEAIKREWI